MVTPPAARFRVTFEAMASDVPAIVRLRAVLKYAFRARGLRCTLAEDLAPPEVVQEPQMRLPGVRQDEGGPA